MLNLNPNPNRKLATSGDGEVQKLRTQDSLDPRHFDTNAEVSVRYFGSASAELSGNTGTSAECNVMSMLHVTNRSVTGAPYNIKSYSLSHS